MSVIGITAEYNPFHFGHEYQINRIREEFGADSTVVCVMSGDFVQRGEPALYSKYARAESACRCGADLVVELPLPWSVSSAEGFARGAVGLMKRLKVDIISFGSESGRADELAEIADALSAAQIYDRVKEILSAEPAMSYAAARQAALEEKFGDKAALIAEPNDLLGVEYLKAIRTLNAGISVFAVQRVGSGHDRKGEGFMSSSGLRELISEGRTAEGLVPDKAYEVYLRETALGRVTDAGRFDAAVMSRLRMLSREDYNALPDAADGVGDRLFKAAMLEPSLSAVVEAASTKRYAVSRIRRMAMCAALGIRDGMAEGVPPYARVLAANKRGCTLLRDISKADDPFALTKPVQVKSFGNAANELFSAGARAHDLYSLAYKGEMQRKGGMEWKTGPFIVK